MNSVRRPVKDLGESKRRWRDKFKQQCTDRMKNARQDKIDRHREEQWMQVILKKEWEDFKKTHEQSMIAEGIITIDDLIEDSIKESCQENEIHLLQEQQELEAAVASYERSLICINCKKSTLLFSNDTQLGSCSACGFYATRQCLSQIEAASFSHGNTCHGSIELSLEPGTNNTLLGVCNICDLWDMFYM